MTQTVTDQALQYGVLGLAVVVFGVVIVILWKQLLKREDKLDAERESMVKERASWELREVEIRKECETRITTATAEFAQRVRDDHKVALEREDDVRREFAEIMERVASEAGRKDAALVEMLQKFYERFVGPKPRY